MKKVGFIAAVFLTSVLYLVLRIGWKDTIEFGYDQPILSSSVVEFIKKPSFLMSYKFVNVNPWGYPSWGPVQIFFWAPFFIISLNPIVVSQMVAIFNLVALLLVVYIAWKKFSPVPAIIAGLILATHPWWVIFSRMIYEPTPVPVFIALSILLFFEVKQKPKSPLLTLLILSWAVLLQFYIHTISFIIPSALLIVTEFKKISKRYLCLGLLLSFVVFIPVIYHNFKQPQDALGFVTVYNNFNSGGRGYGKTAMDTVSNFTNIISGNGFDWQLGYGYQDFQKYFLLGKTVSIFCLIIFGGLIMYNLIRGLVSAKNRKIRVILLLWITGPVWFLVLIKTPVVLPRYFLQSLPSLALLIALNFWETNLEYKNNFAKLAGIFIGSGLLLIVSYWTVFIINYYGFIKNYNYSKGFLSHYSDIPYTFLESAFKVIINDAYDKNYGEITISSDTSTPKSDSFNRAMDYTWNYVMKPIADERLMGEKEGHYILEYNPPSLKEAKDRYLRFGPYVVYEYQ